MTEESVLNILLDKRFLGVYFLEIISILRQNNNLSPQTHPGSGMLQM